jgi:hypothetical protein
VQTDEAVIRRIQLANQWLLETTSDLTDGQFSQRLSYHAPPIGWHLWHISRFTDRLGASFKSPSDLHKNEIWDIENLVEQWGLDPNDLGVLQSGMEMKLDVAASMPIIVGKKRILEYAEKAFTFVETNILDLTVDQLNLPRKSVRAYTRVDGRLIEAEPEKTTTGADLVFHLSHASRHLGSIEALRGVLIPERKGAS